MKISGVSSGGVAAFDHAKKGMRQAEQRLNKASHAIANGDLSADRMVDLIVSERVYASNAKVVKTQDELVGTLLNVAR